MVLSALVSAGLLVGGAAASAAPAPSPGDGAQAAAKGQKVCTVTDARLRELSGLVATRTGYVVVNDGTELVDRKRIFYLSSRCKVTKAVQYSGNGPFDTEDLALSPDGETLWVADTGDNVTSSTHRSKVALWSMPADGSEEPALHRLSYPEREPHDAEALLIGDDGKPLIITKSTGKAMIFTPAAELQTNNTEPVPMKKVGEITLPRTGTDNPLGVAGRIAVTGATRSPDGKRVVLRTYADAFEWDVRDGDLVSALTKGKPRVTPLADTFGEAISYTADGRSYVTVSDVGTLGEDAEVTVLRYTPSTTVATGTAVPGARKPAEQSWFDSLSLDDITYLIGAVGVLGAILVGAGIVGIVRARRRTAEPEDRDDVGPAGARAAARVEPGEPPYAAGRNGYAGGYDHPGPGGYPPGAPEEPEPVGRGRRSPEPAGGVYGGTKRGGGVYGGGGRSSPGPVYGGGKPSGGAVYGGGRPASGVYGAGGAQPGGAAPGGSRRGTGQSGSGGVYGGGPARGARGGYPESGQPGGEHNGGRPARSQRDERPGRRQRPGGGGYRGNDQR